MKIKKKVYISLKPTGPSGHGFSPRASGPAGLQRGINFFFFEFHEYHPWYQVFCAKIFVNTGKLFNKINDIQVTK